MKKLIIGLIIGGIIFGTIGVLGATYLYQAKDVSYNSTNVESAINDLYDRTTKSGLIKSYLSIETSYYNGIHTFHAYGVNSDGTSAEETGTLNNYVFKNNELISESSGYLTSGHFLLTIAKEGYYTGFSAYYSTGSSYGEKNLTYSTWIKLNVGDKILVQYNGGVDYILYSDKPLW